ncbi:hypothetical protein ACQPZP_07990 [Spirillospora sp. CA-142024]|uniref:hypothetical protein n=1 Tax=Spirillospora sp. CA-142024 TaxID=3240036 RepID=UPI003D8F464B
MKWWAVAAGLCALAMTSAGCAAEETPEQKATRKLEKALAALTGEPHRADTEVDVYAHTLAIPSFRMSAQMRGTHRSMPGRPATDLDLFSVKTTIDRQYSEDLVRTGAVRVITVGDQVHVRNTLQSDRWRTLPRGPRAFGKRGYDPASTDAMMNSTMIAAMYRDQAALLSRPSPSATGGEQMSVYSLSCTIADCLDDVPEMRETALSVYPGDALFNSKLWVDERSRPRVLTMVSEFNAGRGDGAPMVKFKATLTLHDLGKPQNITAPPG